MFKSCTYCSYIHKTTTQCPRKPARIKESTPITKFRNTSLWQKKRHHIKQMDLFLCLHCKSNNLYVFKNLEVHHIIPLTKNWSLRLEDSNLITLCSHCHTLAETGEISTDKLYQLIQKRKEVGSFYERKSENGETHQVNKKTARPNM